MNENNVEKKNQQNSNNNEELATVLSDLFVRDYVSLHMYEFAERVAHTVLPVEKYNDTQDIVPFLMEFNSTTPHHAKPYLQDTINSLELLLSRLAVFMYLKGAEDTCQRFDTMQELLPYATQDTDSTIENAERVPLNIHCVQTQAYK